MKLIIDRDSRGFETKEFREYLKTPVLKSEITQQEADELRTQLEEGMKQYPGLGISATQLGIKKRACLIQFGDEELYLVNPVIKEKSKEGFLFYEGCLSIPRTIERPIRTIRACKIVIDTDNLGELTFEINPEGDKQNEQVSKETMMTVIVQHEIDHLDGFTIKDRVYTTTVVKKQTYGRNDKIVMKSTDGEMVEVKYKNANKYFLQGYEIV
ncbi:MAG: peptide deformylase [Bacteroidota bacterium]|jgi:peptide deformylase